MVRTGLLGKRATGRMLNSLCPTWPSITRPLDAPRSIAATVPAEVTTCAPPPCRQLWPHRTTVPGTRATVVRTGHNWAANGRSSQERGGDAGVDGNVQTSRVAEIAGAEHEHGVRHVLGHHLALE